MAELIRAPLTTTVVSLSKGECLEEMSHLGVHRIG